mmetsp:Transcript_21279/g.52407  ORF Transcript_21279/g.52407 Transcript_21279/m.52407 type:complete len:375 (-) Transcript_21279:2187-3311(-)
MGARRGIEAAPAQPNARARARSAASKTSQATGTHVCVLSSARECVLGSDHVLELGAAVDVVAVVVEEGVGGDEGVLGADVEVVVDLPVDLADLAGGVEEALDDVLEDTGGTEGQAHGLDGLEHRVDDVGRGLENVGPHEVEEVRQRILATKPEHPEGQVLDDGRSRLPVHQVAVHQGVLQEWCDGVDVVLAHLPDVLEQEGQGLEHAVLHVELRQAVLVEQRREHREGPARLRHDRNGHRRAHAVLPLLHLEVVEQHREHVLGPDRLGDVPERVDRRTPDRLLVRLEHVQQLKADPHPLLGRHKLRPAIGDTPHEVDAVLLHLLVPVPQDGGEAGEQVLDRGRHLGHADDVDDALEPAEDRPEHLGVLLAEVLV